MLRPAVVVALALVALAAPARASELPARMGMYAPAGAPLAMLDSAIDVRVRGPIVEATVRQTFRNDRDTPTEATYIFPLPDDAAVSAMAIASGARTIRAAIVPRAEAQRRYEDAIRAGLGAGLLDQERPDVFTQTVAAIPAHGTVEVTLRFDTTARYHDGTWELVLPLVVAPRYVPGTASGRPTTGTGRAPDTDRAPDASRVTPGGGPGAGGKTEVTIAFADPVEDVASPSHELVHAAGHYAFTDPHSDHDAMIRWRASVPSAGWVERDRDGGYAAVLVQAPPAAPRTAALRCLLVLDRGATTLGDAEATERPVVRALLAALGGRDHAAVTGSEHVAWGAPAEVARALDARWGRPAAAFDLTRVLEATRASGAAVVLVTAGLVADDRAAIAAARRVGAPVHVIGIGPAPNRSLLSAIARATGGTVRFPAIDDDLAALARDVLADAASPPPPLAVSWGTLAVHDVVPAVLPRLGAGQAVLVLARVPRVERANARARGDVFAFAPIAAPPAPRGATTPDGPLARRWARDRLGELVAAHDARAVEAHALRYGLVSPATSMVAIGDEVVVEGGVKHTRAVPVSVPAGMRWQLVRHTFEVEIRTDTGAEDEDASREKRASRAKKATASADMAATSVEERAPAAGERLAQLDVGTAVAGRRRLRIAAALGGGLVVGRGNADALAAATVRLDFGRRWRFGGEGALWLVGGLHAQGELRATVAHDALAGRLELGGGLGLHLGGGIGPALDLTLRAPLRLHHLAAYLRYDGALLRLDDGTLAAQHAAALGLEARW